MRRLILKMSISVDGFAGGPKGEIDWLLRTMNEGTVTWVHDTHWQAGVHIMGSRTFHDMAAYRPTSFDPQSRFLTAAGSESSEIEKMIEKAL